MEVVGSIHSSGQKTAYFISSRNLDVTRRYTWDKHDRTTYSNRCVDFKNAGNKLTVRLQSEFLYHSSIHMG